MGTAALRRMGEDNFAGDDIPVDPPLCDLVAHTLSVLREPRVGDGASYRGEARNILQALWREPVTRPLVRRATGHE